MLKGKMIDDTPADSFLAVQLHHLIPKDAKEINLAAIERKCAEIDKHKKDAPSELEELRKAKPHLAMYINFAPHKLMTMNGEYALEDEENVTPLVRAVMYGHIEIVKVLIKRNAKVDTRALMSAIWRGHVEILRILRQNKAPIDEEVSQQLMLLKSEATSIEILKTLAERHDFQPEGGETKEPTGSAATAKTKSQFASDFSPKFIASAFQFAMWKKKARVVEHLILRCNVDPTCTVSPFYTIGNCRFSGCLFTEILFCHFRNSDSNTQEYLKAVEICFTACRERGLPLAQAISKDFSSNRLSGLEYVIEHLIKDHYKYTQLPLILAKLVELGVKIPHLLLEELVKNGIELPGELVPRRCAIGPVPQTTATGERPTSAERIPEGAAYQALAPELQPPAAQLARPPTP